MVLAGVLAFPVLAPIHTPPSTKLHSPVAKDSSTPLKRSHQHTTNRINKQNRTLSAPGNQRIKRSRSPYEELLRPSGSPRGSVKRKPLLGRESKKNRKRSLPKNVSNRADKTVNRKPTSKKMGSTSESKKTLSVCFCVGIVCHIVLLF